MNPRLVRVRWIAEGGVEHVGVPLHVINPGEVPMVPAGVARHRGRFRAHTSMAVRMLVVVHEDGVGDQYYAPHVGSLEEFREHAGEAVRA